MAKANVQTTLRVPQDLYERVARQAQATGISINEWATAALREKADRDDGGTTASRSMAEQEAQ